MIRNINAISKAFQRGQQPEGHWSPLSAPWTALTPQLKIQRQTHGGKKHSYLFKLIVQEKSILLSYIGLCTEGHILYISIYISKAHTSPSTGGLPSADGDI